MNLNEEQLAAATHPQGEAALLLAGAGSGKTATLTERIAWLIEQGVPSRRILALTFTNKAAGEIRERVLQRTNLPPESSPRLTTIHSLALSFIRRNPGGFGLGEKVTPLADYDQVDLLKRLIERKADREKWGEKQRASINVYGTRDKISFLRARGYPFRVDYTLEAHKLIEKVHSGFHTPSTTELEIWEEFEQEKVANSTIDFDDMLAFVNRRMRSDSEWAGKVQQLFVHILMDEAQDTNVPAWEFVNHLVGPHHRNLYCVGDVSQSIFGFIGAAPNLIMDFSRGWREGSPVVYKLQRNHRSGQAVVDLANDIQQTMTDTLPLTMESFRGMSGEKGAARLMQRENPYDLAGRIAREIEKVGGSYSNFAILIRAASQVRELEGELIRARIPYVVRGGRGLLQSEEARDVLSYIRLLTNPKDFSALVRASSAPSRGIGDVTLESIRTLAKEQFDGNLINASFAMGGKCTTFADTLNQIKQYVQSPVAAFEQVIAYTDYGAHVKKKYKKDPEKITNKLENLSRLREMIEGLVAPGDMTAEDLIFQLTMDRTEEHMDNGAVTISTIHSAKGLEWPTVFVFNVIEGMLPSKFCTTPSEVEEERRLWYVATTRARDLVYITVADKGYLGRNLVDVEPSRFLGEIGIEVK